AGAGDGGLAHRLTDDLAAAEDGLVAADGVVLGDLDEQIGVGQADAVTRRRPEQGCVAAALDLHQPSSPTGSSGPATSPRRPGTMRAPARATRVTSRSMPGS